MANHNQVISVKQMVLNRLPFLADTAANTLLLSQYTLEAMYELEYCFRIRVMEDGTEDMARVGNEQFYNVYQLSIVSDLVALYVLMTQFIGNMGGIASDVSTIPSTPSVQTFLRRAKAGSVEVEYEQFDTKISGLLATDANTLIGQFKKDLMRKARNFGCIFDICDDCSIMFMKDNAQPPFLLFGGDAGCVGCGS